MPTRRRFLAEVTALVCFGLCSSGRPAAGDVPPLARRLSAFYDHLDVEDRWIAGQHVDWRTGEPDGQPERLPGRHTHCSAFVAAVAERLGIYILRSPEHGQVLLANAQNEWLPNAGRDAGWLPLSDALAAQKVANAGVFVVASYHNHQADHPGHIAIVRPSRKAADVVADEGPDVIQAGTRNFTDVSLREGFAGHPHAWIDDEIQFYAHEIPKGRL
ncbi:hypothetical protein [Lichenifustis flavocetrariae]|uniref:Uncharacterized protein n=1 Tax=Lichenifustis flavocetrariae TaxID=2949735 RepID=A0AA41YZW9_9HYPH|nr:hypothetical protein [Lichenifustis flavocetrariae]MCW6507973.1 hypothetical protein [Lichenifustis flavocetrariae]